MADQPIIFFTNSDTTLGTAIAKNVYYTNCKELLVRGGRISHWRVNGTTTGSVEIDAPAGTAGYEICLVPGANIQTRPIPDGVAVMFHPSDLVKVVSLDEPHELIPVYQSASTE